MQQGSSDLIPTGTAWLEGVTKVKSITYGCGTIATNNCSCAPHSLVLKARPNPVFTRSVQLTLIAGNIRWNPMGIRRGLRK